MRTSLNTSHRDQNNAVIVLQLSQQNEVGLARLERAAIRLEGTQHTQTPLDYQRHSALQCGIAQTFNDCASPSLSANLPQDSTHAPSRLRVADNGEVRHA